ncbi:MAG: dihydrodipicolinate synthase family protein [Deltaproteobacteria bacterium]|nr:dihydrodipicolinate synthase family protein [Deltaproteobacteria bacterium]MBW2150863.1 dihydrodipicolinate synthase family protein [Deltaproteobacteria bacterium]
MITSKDIKGVIAAIATPFKDNEDLDLQGLGKLTRHLIDCGVDGIMAVGGTGEFPHLDREEKKTAIEVISKEAKGNVPVIANTSACSTREALQLMEDARQAGADAAIMVPPYYFVLDDSALFYHFKTLAEAKLLPVVVYNNPLYTGNPMGPSLLAELMEIPNIIGLKQSQTDMGQLVEVIRLTKKESSLCTGIDSQFFPSLMIGAKGIYSTAASVIPGKMKKIYTLYLEGKIEEAKTLHIAIQVLNRFLEYDPGYVSPAKEALRMLGLPAGPVRRPMPELTEKQKEGLKQALKAIGEL